MPLTEQDQIVQIGAAAHNPGHHMMRLEMPGLMAAGIAAHRVPNHQRTALRLADQTPRAAQGQRLAMFVDKGTEQPIVAGKLLGGGRLNRTDTFNVTHRLRRLSRSRSNVRRSRGNVRRICGQVFRGHACTTTRVRSSPDRSSGPVPRKPRATSNSASVLLYVPTPGADACSASPHGSGFGGGGPN
jgi:hypothetical protein